MSRFFIDRPVFAWVLALTIMLIGGLSILRLPVEQYPRIAPPSVAITTSYPGASAQTLENSVTQVIEQKMNGLDHLRYMASTSDSTGTLTITLTFDPEANPDIAQVQVQNKLQLALPLLPQEVQQQGVKVAKAAKSFLMVIGLVSADGRTAANDLTDYLSSRLQDDISRVPGVGEVMLLVGFCASTKFACNTKLEDMTNWMVLLLVVKPPVQPVNVTPALGVAVML